MHNFKKLTVWHDSMDLVLEVYIASKTFPKEEMYGLTQQIRRSAVSIPSNIAEGSGRKTLKDFENYLSIAHASALELETQLIIAKQLCYLNKESFIHLEQKLTTVQKKLFKLKESLHQNT